MKWIGQHIWDFISRFRNYIYVQKADISTSTTVLVIDEEGKVGKNTGIGSTGVTSITSNDGVASTGEAITPNLAVTGAVNLRVFAYDGGANVGYVPAGGSASTFLRGDGTWVTPTNTTYSAMTTSVLGIGKLRYAINGTPAANAQTTTAGRTYGITDNDANQLIVNVPWTDTDTTYSMMTNTTLGLGKLEDNTVQTVAANAVTATASRTYGIQRNSSNQLVVNVPWTSGTSYKNDYFAAKCESTALSSATDGEASAVLIPFTAEILKSTTTIFGLGSGAAAGCLTISTASHVALHWNIASDTSVVNNRVLGGVKLQKGCPEGDGYVWTDIDPTHGYLYNRGTGSIREASVSGSILINHVVESEECPNPIYRLVLWKVAASNASTKVITQINGCQLTAQRLS